jgi:hypothetical protein
VTRKLNFNSVSTGICKFPRPTFCILFEINEMLNESLFTAPSGNKIYIHERL